VLVLALGAFAIPHYGQESLVQAFLAQRAEVPTAETLWAVLIGANALMAAFNMLPALPMDGGRVLRALLAWVVGQEKATRWAALVARVLAAGFVVLGLFSGAPMLALIGAFVFFGAGYEVRAVRGERLLKAVRTRDAVNPYAPRFQPDTALGEAMQALVFTPFPAFAVEHFGRLVGVVTREGLARAADEAGPGGYVAGAMQREVPTVDASATLEDARLKMSEAGSAYVAVVDGGLFLGLLTEAELARHAALGEALRPPPRRSPRDVREW
jgi:CBS domain-containing protein